MKKFFTAFFIIYIFFLYTAVHADNQILTLNTANDPPNATISFDGIADRIVKEAFDRLNLPIKQIRLVSERAISNVNDGIDDGNYSRVEGLEKTYPNLIRVPESIIRFEFSVFSYNKNISVKSWGSLGDYNIAIIRGWKILEKNITKHKSLTLVNDEEQLFQMLNMKRVDIVFYDKLQGNYLLKRFNYNTIFLIGKPLEVKDMFLYMNRKHAQLVPRIAGILKKIKADGTYARIKNEALKKYIYLAK